jgi:hypothetical protein
MGLTAVNLVRVRRHPVAFGSPGQQEQEGGVLAFKEKNGIISAMGVFGNS